MKKINWIFCIVCLILILIGCEKNVQQDNSSIVAPNQTIVKNNINTDTNIDDEVTTTLNEVDDILRGLTNDNIEIN